MNHEHPYEELSAYTDGALSGESLEGLEEHLESCETCRRRLDVIRASKHRLAGLGASTEPTDALRRKVERHADSTASEQKQSGVRSWFDGRMAVALVVAARVPPTPEGTDIPTIFQHFPRWKPLRFFSRGSPKQGASRRSRRLVDDAHGTEPII